MPPTPNLVHRDLIRPLYLIFVIQPARNDPPTASTHGKAKITRTTKPAKTSARAKTKKSDRRNMFIDDEAAVSGDDSEDEYDDSFIATQTHFTQTVDEGDPSVDMRAKYLQSIR